MSARAASDPGLIGEPGGRHSLGGQPTTLIRPGTVLVVELGSGVLVLQGYPTGGSAYVSAKDGQALREVLDTAFAGGGRAMDVPPIVKPRI